MGFEVLNFLLTSGHVMIILIISFGWIWRKLHVVYVICNFCAIFSWFILGYFKGYGYCLLTDIQWNLLAYRGETDIPETFLEYFFNILNINSSAIDFLEVVNYFKYFVVATFVFRMSYIYLLKKGNQ
ncbi:MAG: hypothetical protein FD155_2367 [Bacteroidetes bacterium]|nr:MAG: hypothetical protein FD155_2367 [Bacteroidota bacterium]